ncbi:cell adhesion molecule 4 [Eurytemora carolleeae]|uniref:cell adhesion molecule 4 n=1 Tax=Eurytemora carolleeae TaxID=1294199 RepID=UPI000C795163|nr:cell adhesion molecule 4 [Eurytemora carolleeae]|eukprot:XP_023347584.1 cell adhesion molecule 4-like [Eurytemora affinis]
MKHEFRLLLCGVLLALSGEEVFGIKILSISEKLLAKPGSDIKISCGGDSPFTWCSWILPSNASCSDLGVGRNQQCRREPNLRFNGTDTECNVVLKNVKREHSGTWICGMYDSSTNETSSLSTILDVFEEASLDFKTQYGIVTVIAGNPVSFLCEADHSRPVGKFKWHFGSNPVKNRILNTESSVLFPLDEPGLYRVEEKLVFTPQPKHDGEKIHCSYYQYGMNKEVLFSSMVDIDLRVEFLNILPSPRLPPVYTGDTLNISVEVHGSPGPYIHWEILGENTLVISQGNPEQSQKYNLLPTQQVDKNKYITTLKIQNISVEDMDKTFKMVVNSSKVELSGEQEFRITVDKPWPEDEDVPSQADPKTAIILVISLIILLILAIIIGLTVLYAKKQEKWCFQNNTPYISPEIKEQSQPLASSEVKHHPYGRPSPI